MLKTPECDIYLTRSPGAIKRLPDPRHVSFMNERLPTRVRSVGTSTCPTRSRYVSVGVRTLVLVFSISAKTKNNVCPPRLHSLPKLVNSDPEPLAIALGLEGGRTVQEQTPANR